MFKELGCKVDHLKKSESSTGIAQKYAHLAIPLSFPKKTR